MKVFISVLMAFSAVCVFSQRVPPPCDTNGMAAIRNNLVFEQWEFRIDKKTKKKTFSAYREFDSSGCLGKIILPSASMAGSYNFSEWQYGSGGRLQVFREGTIDSDSAKRISFSENYSYTFDGKLSRFKKETYEGEMSQTIEKIDYSYSPKSEVSEITYSVLRVRKDTISNDEIKYNENGKPYERTIHNYYPKGLSEFTKYNADGLPVEHIRYDKGKPVQHKIYSYTYDKSGQLVEESVSDGIGKTVEKKKYEKDKITLTKLNTKGKVLSTSSLPYSAPQAVTFPAKPEIISVNLSKKEAPKYSSSKQKFDKKKNRIVENYSGDKLVSTETYDIKGLLIEINPADGDAILKYEYTFY